MQGYQFAHMETWSRQGGAVQNGRQETVRRNGQRSWSAQQIIDEAERVPDACEHVPYTGRKPLVLAGTCGSFDELRKAHEAASTVKLSFPYRDKKTGKTSTRRRQLRADTHSLYTAVISLPITSEEALADPDKMRECLRVFRMAKAFEKRRIEAAGGELAMAVIHCDEGHFHMHLYGLDRTRGSVNALHPGRAALDAFRERHGTRCKRGTNLFAQSKRAYCDAMREWQGDLHREVFSKVGLLRYGPKRARLSRPDYVKARQAAEERARTAADLKDIQQFREAASSITALLDEREADIDEREDILDAREAQVAGLTASLEKRSEELRKTAEKTAVAAQETATKAAGFADREDALKVRESMTADRKAKVERREEKVDERDKCSMARASELEASLAAVEAMTAGLAEYDETGMDPTMRPTAAAQSDSGWPDILARIKVAPAAALATAGRLSKSLSAIRAKATAEGLAEARKSALDELRDAFQAIRNASTSLGHVNSFTKGLIARLTSAPQREAEEQMFHRLTKVAGTDVFKAKFAATKNGLEDDAIE